MSDLSVGTVVDLSPLLKRTGIAGEAITAGECVYIDATVGKWKKAQASSLAASGYGSQVGIAVTAAGGDGDAFTVAVGGDLDLGVAPTKGTIYVVSDANAGGIAPWADLGSGNYVTILGVGNSSEVLSMSVFASGIAHA